MPLPHNSQIHEANINIIGRDYVDQRQVNHSNVDPEKEGKPDFESRQLLDKLGRESSRGAISNSEERAYAPRCHPETRANVLNDLENWSAGEGPWKDVQLLVLTGPAGHGKSAIMQSFSERLLKKSAANSHHHVVATFFFKATIPEQNQPKALVTTLAHQIAAKCPSIQRNIVAVIRDDVRIFSTSLEHQMERLLVKPISDLRAASPIPSLTVISAVDGLDECDGDEYQSRVIRLLHTLSKIPGARVVLASRPEFPIMTAVERGMPGVLHVDLNKAYEDETWADIYKFTWSRLQEIRDELLPRIDPQSWPRKADAQTISDYSSGQFILSDTAMRYVSDRRYDPRERLEEVLLLCKPRDTIDAGEIPTPAPPRITQPLGALDSLFTGILKKAARNAYPEDPEEGQLKLASLVWILIGIIPQKVQNSASWEGDAAPLWVIEEFLGLRDGAITRQLSDLHSLLDVPQEVYTCEDIHSHHKSFHDFLGDPQRSGRLGDILQTAKNWVDQMIQTNLRRITEDDLKRLILAQHMKPPVLHHLHWLCTPQVVIDGIGAAVWKNTLPSLNTWQTLCLRDWVSAGLIMGPLAWARNSSHFLQDTWSKSWGNILPGISAEDLPSPQSVSDTDLEDLRVSLNAQRDWMATEDASPYIPAYRTEGIVPGGFTRGFPWFPAARVLSFLWAPRHRLVANCNDVNTPNSPLQEQSLMVFIVGSPCSGKRGLLKEAYRLLPVGLEDDEDAWAPPVDIIIMPSSDGRSLNSRWTSNPLQGGRVRSICHNWGLMEDVELSHQTPVPRFQDWAACWKGKDERNAHHPQFLLQNLHLLSPEYQGVLLDMILFEGGLSESTGTAPLFITVTSLPTATLLSKLGQFSAPGLYFFNLDVMKADPALVEQLLLFDFQQGQRPPASKVSKLARILANSPRPHHDFKTLRRLRLSSDPNWEKRLDPILASPEPEAWRLFDEHLGDLISDVVSEESHANCFSGCMDDSEEYWGSENEGTSNGSDEGEDVYVDGGDESEGRSLAIHTALRDFVRHID